MPMGILGHPVGCNMQPVNSGPYRGKEELPPYRDPIARSKTLLLCRRQQGVGDPL